MTMKILIGSNNENKLKQKEFPKIIQEVGFDFDWDEKKVWKLEIPETEMSIQELTWHFDISFLWEKEGAYNLTPREVMNDPGAHKGEYHRTMKADMKYPIDIMENKGRWLILDGLHRLMKVAIFGEKSVKVRIIPRDKIPEILKD